MNEQLHEWLFYRTTCELAERSQVSDTYQIITSSALTRHLLLDREPLLHKVQKKTGTKTIFSIFTIPEKVWNQNQVFAFQNIGEGPPSWRKEVALKQFLSTEAIKAEGETFTIRFLIIHVASVLGGVHTFKPKDDKERLLVELGNTFLLGNEGVVMKCTRDIAIAVSRSLLPIAIKLSTNKEQEQYASSLLEKLNSQLPKA